MGNCFFGNESDPKGAVCRVDTEITRQLRAISCGIRKYFERLPVKQELDNITGMHGWLLGYLADNADRRLCQRDLERELSLSRSAVSKLLKIMEENDLVTRVHAPGDDRLKIIVLTDRAKLYHKKCSEDNLRIEQQLTDGFSAEELQTLRDYLNRIRANADRLSASGKEQ